MPADAKPIEPGVAREIWVKMTGIYGHRWVSAYGVSPEHADGNGRSTIAGAMWTRGLAGLTKEQVRAAISRAVVSAEPFPPTLPEFRAMALGIPPLPRVQLVLERPDQQGEYRPFCRLVWLLLDVHQYRSGTAPSRERMLKGAYQLAREHVMALGDIPPESKLLERQKRERQPASPETAAHHLEKIRQLVGAGLDESAGEAEQGGIEGRDHDAP